MGDNKTIPHQGNNGFNTIVGAGANELLQGHKGNDVLIGEHGNDKINGGHEADYISGNWGADVLRGGHGADTFVFDGDYDQEVVKDFDGSEGDMLEFVLYGTGYASYDSAAIWNLAVQNGNDVTITLPGTDQVVVLHNTDLAELAVEMIEVTTIL